MIDQPYLLYCGDATDPLSVKTARGIVQWRPEAAVGQFRSDPAGVGVGLEDIGLAKAAACGARTLVIGVANAGGIMSATMVADVLSALREGLDVASGLHQRLSRHVEIAETAASLGRKVWDVREPPAGLVVGSGVRRAGRRLLTVGTDCAVGKMYATLALERALQRRGVSASFRATGQTGILIAGEGMPVDAVVADFIAGSVERLSPARHDQGWDLIEGQGSLFHPSYAGVSLGLLHGAQPDALILCHEAGRTRMRHLGGYKLPLLDECLARNLEAARLTNPDVVAVGVALNTSALSLCEAKDARESIESALHLPCEDPIATGMERIADRLMQIRTIAA